MLRTKLENWEFRLLEPEPGYEQPFRKPSTLFPAQVPGMIHLDLARNGLIPDPLAGSAHMAMAWIDESSWLYRTEFKAEPGSFPNAILRFDCIDGFATIWLNGIELARHDSAFLPLELSVLEHLQAENVLEIRFDSAIAEASSRRAAYLLEHGLPYDQRCFDERAFLRKPAYMWGWDWAPRLISCGIAGEVELLQFEDHLICLGVRIEHLEDSKYKVSAEPKSIGKPPEIELALGSQGHATRVDKNSWIIEGGEWHPAGTGPQTIHTLRAISGGDLAERRFGLRRVQLLRELDSFGESFAFEVNGKPIWAKGANWIPPRFFYAQAFTEIECDQQIAELASLGMNMLRVWGGGRYENEWFYNACDRHGILVWQDFRFAFMYYPDSVEWQAAIRDEASYHVERLCSHPSLAIWCGNNECQTMHESWLGQNAAPSLHGERLYNDVLPKVVANLDPGTPYVSTSPTGSDPAGPLNCNNPSFGTCHYWEVWHGKGDWVHYRDVEPRFCAEFGFASSCSMAAWVQAISPSDIRRFPGPEFLAHDKTGKDFEKTRSLVELHYPRAETLEEWVYYSQLNQRDAIRCALEQFLESPACAGALVWQANDCWPGSTWSLRDSAGLLKPAWFEVERLFSGPFILARFCNGELVAKVAGAPTTQVCIHRFDTLAGNELEPSDFKESAPVESAFRISADGVEESWIYPVEPKQLTLKCQPLELSRGAEWHIRVDGFVADLVAYGAHSYEPLRLLGQLHRGSKPVTGANRIIKYLPPCADEPIILRSLAGVHEVRNVG